MTPAQRRVAIAKEVIANINAKTFKIKKMTYVHIDHEHRTGRTLTRERATELLPHCEVCALGSLLMCRIAKFGSLAPAPLDTNHVTHGRTRQGLADAFDEDELNLIESAFELANFGRGQCGWESAIDAIRFGRARPRKRDRLLAIMHNIVDNKGTFVPS